MIARIGIADTGRDVEVAIDSKDEFVSRVEAAYDRRPRDSLDEGHKGQGRRRSPLQNRLHRDLG